MPVLNELKVIPLSITKDYHRDLVVLTGGYTFIRNTDFNENLKSGTAEVSCVLFTFEEVIALRDKLNKIIEEVTNDG
jgi:hypothetical protein